MNEYVEEFRNGDGYEHLCSFCGGSIGESDSHIVTVEGYVYHSRCWYDEYN